LKVVVDASAALEIALNRKHAAALARVIDESETTFAPDFYVAEVTNAIWKEHHFGGCEADICEAALGVLLDLIDFLVPSPNLFRDAFTLSKATGGPAYDMFYLALARRENAVLLTLDTRLRKQAAKLGVHAR